MDEQKYIEKIKFIPFLRRELSLLATSIVMVGYTKGLKEQINFKFKNICYLSDGLITDSLRTETELKQYNNIVKKKILNEQRKCYKFLDQGLKINNQVRRLIKEKKNYKNYSSRRLFKDLKNKLSIYIDLFLFSTVLPFEIGQALNFLMKDNKIKSYSKLEDKINKLRIVSFYTIYEEKILKNIFQEISKRKGINDYKLLSNLTYLELLSFVNDDSKFTEKELVYRKKYVNLLTPKVSFIKFGEKNYKKYYQIFVPKIKKKAIMIKGRSAYPGAVKGRVRVILVAKDIVKFKQGEILVTISSNPVLMPAIKKASAIISDEGGITCHAAIISRELKIPCIIGTKTATKLLKTGNFIEIDAEKGIVKKVNN